MAATLDPCLFVVFGATGDLMRRKLLPALFNLARDKHLPESFRILGVARDSGMDDHGFRAWARASLADAGHSSDAILGTWCDSCLNYQALKTGAEADYLALGARIGELERTHDMPANRLYYLALPPGAFPGTIELLGAAGLARSPGWTRLVIEKPFGTDLASAQRLNALLHRHFDESQVYRIDHYLGKETVQNLLAFRFGNALFESAWNREHVAAVQITVAEELGVEGRAGYYERAGALRDMVQNHLTQLLTLTAMEPPAAYAADSIRHEKVKVLRSLTPIGVGDAVFAQYAPGGAGAQRLAGYREEPGVSADSRTETFVALRLAIDNWRWQGVPFHLRTGKCLERPGTQIAIRFRRPPVALFRSLDCGATHPNVLVISLQPDEGFDLTFEVKSPGARFELQTQRMRFRYAEAFGPLPLGYQTLLPEVMRGDQTLFVHADETEGAWRLYAPLLENPPPLHTYPAGSWGPPEAERLIADDGCAWTMA